MEAKQLVVTRKKLFTKEECISIIDNKDKYNLSPATTFGEYSIEENPNDPNRIGNIGWIDVDKFPYMDRIRTLVAGYNQIENYILNDNYQLQFCEYGPGAWFKKHQDTYLSMNQRTAFVDTRKISMTIQLSDDQDYTGGDVIITIKRTETGSQGYPISRQQGDAIVFPSYFNHQVNQINSGKRYSLVVWAHGPHWK